MPPELFATWAPAETDPKEAASATARERLAWIRPLLWRVAPALLPLLFGALWEWASRAMWISPLLFPAPSEIATAALALARSGMLWAHVASSVELQLLGLAGGVLAGVLLGLAVGLWRIVDDLLDTSFVILQAIPTLALIPLLILWLGGEQGTRALVVSLCVFFPVYVNTLGGVRMVDRKLVEVGRALGFSRTQIARRILLPHAAPQIGVGIRQSLKMAWVGVVVAEMMIASATGIYFMMHEARSFGQTSVVYLGLILFAGLGAVTDLIIHRLLRQALPWTVEPAPRAAGPKTAPRGLGAKR